MELIARVVIRRFDMGEAPAGHPLRPSPDKSLAVFRVQGGSVERAMKLLAGEMDRQDNPTVVLALDKGQISDNQQSTFMAVYSQSRTLGTKLVVCGGDPDRMFDRLAIYRDSLSWFPNLSTYVSSLELNGRH
jgi:hypothetical protein